MDPVDLIEPGLTGLHRSVAAGVFPILAEGERIWIRSTASRPGFHVGAGQRTLATVSTPALGTAANALLFPGIVRRDFPTSPRSVVETLLAAPGLPLAVIQWTGSPGRVELQIPGTSVEEVMVDEGSIRVGDSRLEIRLAPADGMPTVVETPAMSDRPAVSTASGAFETSEASEAEKELRVVLEAPSEGPTTLVLAFEGEGRTGPASRYLDAARHAGAHAVRAAQGPGEGLLLATGIPEVDEGVQWLRARLAGQARRLAGSEPRLALAVGLACIAVGDEEAAEAALRSFPATSPEGALLAARFAATFGDTRHALRAAREWVSREPATSEGALLAARAMRELSDSLHLAADPGTIAQLRNRAEAVGARGRAAGAGGPATEAGGPATEAGGPATASRFPAPTERRLPMATGPTPAREEQWWTDLLDGAPTILTTSFAQEPDAAWVAWRQLLSGQDDGSSSAAPTLWDAPDAAERSVTAELLLALAGGLLGLRPDAAVGRLTLAPRLPAHLIRFAATGIRLGASVLTLRYAREEGSRRFEIEPVTAAVPPLLVFEPTVSGEVSEVRVDGEAAELDARRMGGHTVVPVQLPLDAPRVVEIAVDRRRE